MTNQAANRKTIKRSQSVDAKSRRKRVARQLAAYSIAAGAGVAGAENALAAPIPVNLPGGGPVVVAFAQTVGLDLDNNGIGDFSIENYLGNSSPMIIGSSASNIIDTDSISTYSGFYLATLFGAGELIDGSSGGGFGFVQFADLDNFFDTRGFVGLRFDIPGGSSLPHFAYLDVEVDTTAKTVTIYSGAYESQPFVGITTVPEPAGLGLLATGAAGLAVWHRRREGVTPDGYST